MPTHQGYCYQVYHEHIPITFNYGDCAIATLHGEVPDTDPSCLIN